MQEGVRFENNENCVQVLGAYRSQRYRHAAFSRCSSRKCQFLRFLSSDATQVLSLQSRVQKTRCSADLPS